MVVSFATLLLLLLFLQREREIGDKRRSERDERLGIRDSCIDFERDQSWREGKEETESVGVLGH